MALVVENLAIEVTRRCNLMCDHCLRGDAQNTDFNVNYLKEFLKNNDINCISTITFSGGEPSLVPHIIRDCLVVCKELSVNVNNFYLVTNGKIAKDRIMPFCQALLEWYAYCEDNETTQVHISNSYWHMEQGAPDEETVRILNGLRFVSKRTELSYEYVIAEGKAEEWAPVEAKEPDTYVVEKFYDDTYISEGFIYLNALGEIVPGCDFSYQRQSELKLGTYKDKLLMLDNMKVSE